MIPEAYPYLMVFILKSPAFVREWLIRVVFIILKFRLDALNYLAIAYLVIYRSPRRRRKETLVAWTKRLPYHGACLVLSYNVHLDKTLFFFEAFYPEGILKSKKAFIKAMVEDFRRRRQLAIALKVHKRRISNYFF